MNKLVFLILLLPSCASQDYIRGCVDALEVLEDKCNVPELYFCKENIVKECTKMENSDISTRGDRIIPSEERGYYRR